MNHQQEKKQPANQTLRLRFTLSFKGMEHSCVLVQVLIFLMMTFPQASAATHSLQYSYTALTPGIHFPEFTAVGLVDGEQFVSYDSNMRKMIPKTEWIQNISTDSPDYWNRETQDIQSNQEKVHQLLVTVMKDFNHTEGFHTLQRMYSCELHDDGTVRGFDQFGYDGEDFISLDLKTGTWTAAKPQAEIIRNQFNNDTGFTVDQKNYLENECISWLKKFVSYGRETLERKVRPEASVFQDDYFSPEVVCHATGFFPKAVMISWRKDGEDVHEDVELRETLPNQDGSFQKRSILKVPAEELDEHNYTCVIQHSSLEKDIIVNIIEREYVFYCGYGPEEYEEVLGGLSRGLKIAIIIGVVVVLVASVAGFLIWKKRKMSDLFKHVPLSSNA
ncbi:BOLA class I histocompatibility antigen, alpha chain BL3-7-like isoform X2 [Tachysurus fulvidraco]|uniref:BOLA class I histocompatibility antigen, alpha chain BL3-7-like isoform X2 n=1 Tax=Tachysurus fulvidraco TaxID=1234273 RepID=UPI001FEFDE62|nr:BOLA class I histocompatibility antigen, alpha chain BL3-7-like isoform X2 [Tachysurus fulvidraco]